MQVTRGILGGAVDSLPFVFARVVVWRREVPSSTVLGGIGPPQPCVSVGTVVQIV